MRGLLPIAFLAACGTSTKSTYVETRGFYVTYTIAQRPSGAPLASAEFQVGDASGTHLELVSGDAVSCDGIPLPPEMSRLYPTYAAEVPAGKPSYAFVLTRPGEADTAASVAAPPLFVLTSGPLDAGYSASLTLTWRSGGATGKVTIKATSTDVKCQAKTVAEAAPDTGSYVLAASSFLPLDKSKPDCSYVVELTRDEISTVGAPLAGGKLVSRGVDSTVLHLHP